jgi:hypothetical protein
MRIERIDDIGQERLTVQHDHAEREARDAPDRLGKLIPEIPSPLIWLQ